MAGPGSHASLATSKTIPLPLDHRHISPPYSVYERHFTVRGPCLGHPPSHWVSSAEVAAGSAGTTGLPHSLALALPLCWVHQEEDLGLAAPQ